MRATALAWGLVNRVVPAADLDAAVHALTDVIAREARPRWRWASARSMRRWTGRSKAPTTLAGETMACNMLDPTPPKASTRSWEAPAALEVAVRFAYVGPRVCAIGRIESGVTLAR